MPTDGTLKFDTSLDSGGLQSGMGKLAGIAQTALGVFSGQMMTRAVDGLANLGKAALDSVGSLEQNVGGVETLFGDAADAVIAAADRAYQTAGLSANDYMSTVTSFSASLLQSLGGNTEEAAKVADMAIIDMADNANKMGTSMDAIQNAYQGFAKQNYTMLDNLKLGYGGTKSEMERLLKDAQELSGVEYDINNLNDVYQAIHVVQGELGITGTTAKEAATTLEGSMAAAKAAWDNFMNGSGDAEQLADALGTAAENIVTNLGQIIPRLVETLPQLITAVAGQIPTLAGMLIPAILGAVNDLLSKAAEAVTSFDFVAAAQSVVDMTTNFIEGDGLGSFLDTVGTILTGIVTGLSSMLPVLLPALVELVSYIVTTLIDNLPMLLDAALTLIQGLADGLLAALPVLISVLPEVITSIVTFLVNSIPQILDAGIQLLMALVDALPTIIQALVAALPEIVMSIVTTLVGATPRILETGIQLFMALIEAIPTIVLELVRALSDIIVAIIDGLIAAGPQVLESAKELWGQITEAVPEIISKLGEVIPDLISGIVNGLANGASAVWDAACELGSNILGGIKSFFGINSPSTVMQEQGDYLVQGMINGITELPGKLAETLQIALSNVLSWGSEIASMAANAMTDLLNRVVSIMSQLPGNIWSHLSSAASKVVSWGSDLVSKGAAAAWQLFNSVINGLRSLPDQIRNIGSNIVSGLWNGISSGWDWLKNNVSSLARGLLDAAKGALGIGSPSRLFRDEVGKWILPGVQSGLAKTMPETLSDMEAKAGELVSAMQAEMTASAGQFSMGVSGATALRALPSPVIQNKFSAQWKGESITKVYLDSREVGKAVAPYIDEVLG